MSTMAFGIKLEVDARILPRDVALGTKLIILVPQKCKTVRAVKNYIADSVLKTPIALNLYIGEYRLRDEDDVLVFTCFPDPCRVAPAGNLKTPSPASAPARQESTTASTSVLPNQKNLLNEFADRSAPYPAAKRVKFNDTPVTPYSLPKQSSGAVLANATGFDQIDEGSIRVPVGESLSLGGTQTAGATEQMEQSTSDNDNAFNNGMIVDESMIFADVGQRKKKRRQRRRHKKNIVLNSDDSFNEPGAQSTLINAADINDAERRNILNGNSVNGTNGSNGASFFGDVETDPNTPPTPEDSSFKKPQPRKSILRNSTSLGVINEANSGSTPCGISSTTNTHFISTPVSKRSQSRPDTPVLPRVLKNPKIFEMVQQNLGSQLRALEFNSSIAEESENQKSSSPIIQTQKKQVSTATEAIKEVKVGTNERDENFYDALPTVLNADDITVGDTIVFKTLEMDEKYSPRVSPYKEALIVSKNGSNLTLNYIRQQSVERTGIFEIEDEDFIGDQIDETIKDFSSLIEVKIVKGGT